MLRGSLGVRSFQKTIVQQPRGMGVDDALRGHRHGVVVVVAAAAVAFFCVHFYDAVSRPTLHLTNRVANIVHFGFFRFPYHFSSRWPCESST